MHRLVSDERMRAATATRRDLCIVASFVSGNLPCCLAVSNPYTPAHWPPGECGLRRATPSSPRACTKGPVREQRPVILRRLQPTRLIDRVVPIVRPRGGAERKIQPRAPPSSWRRGGQSAPALPAEFWGDRLVWGACRSAFCCALVTPENRTPKPIPGSEQTTSPTTRISGRLVRSGRMPLWSGTPSTLAS